MRTLLLPLLLGACSAVPDRYEVLANDPGPAVTDPAMRAAILASGQPWKVRDRESGIELVLVMPGEFVMGSPEGEPGRKPHEGPQRRVRLTRPYYLGEAGVTQAEWRRVMGEVDSFFPGDDLPIDPSYDQVEQFLRRANAAGGPALRLPTEAEWEYACRAGSDGPHPFDGEITQALVNHNDGQVARAVVVDGRLEVDWLVPASAECAMRTVPARSLPPNAWGLHEMLGNLWEWTADRYQKQGYPRGDGSVVVDPFDQPFEGDLHALRGGSWYDGPTACRSAARDGGARHTRSNRIGLRVARSVTPTQ